MVSRKRILFHNTNNLVNDKFPVSVSLQYVPYSKEKGEIIACSNPTTFNLEKELPGKKIVLTSAIGAFTPPCTEDHLPTYLNNIKNFKSKGVDKIIVLTDNDPFVNSAWGKALGYKDEENYVIFATDPNAALSKNLGKKFIADMTDDGFGVRTSRYAAIIDNGVIKYLESEDGGGFTSTINAYDLLKKLD